MPYISEFDRFELDNGAAPTNVGELTYALTKIILAYVRQTGKAAFADYADAIAALEATKFELYRRAVAPHEDAKIVQNGDVYA